jgi:carotenoid cleavage dioxygenase
MLSRRDVLHAIGAGVLTAAAAPALAACARDTSTASAPAGTGTVPAPYDPNTPYWLQGNFAPVPDELFIDDLIVEGSLPRELDGLFVRNGSNPATGRSPHWFLGDGMVHGVRVEDGRARWYANRYVQTTPYEARSEFTASGAPGGPNNQSNVSAFFHGGRLLTSGEVGFPYELSVDDLSTIGAHDFGGGLTSAMTAHPKIDPATGEMHFFGYGFTPPYLTYYVVAADGTLRHREEVTIPNPVMMHDFAITERDVVFWDLPVVFDLEEAIAMVNGKAEAFPFRWDPAAGARVGVMPLGGPASAIRWVEIDPCYVFHGTNAYRSGDQVLLDVCQLPYAFGDQGDLGSSSVHRWTIDAGGPQLRFTSEQVNELSMDLPGIDRRFVGRPYRHGWYAVTEERGDAFDFAGVYRMDHDTGAIDRWDPGPAIGAGEGVFVARGDDEGDGWLVTFAYDRTRDTSDFVVLDATDMASGPVGRVSLPRRVPYGFHGWWIDTPVA